LLDSLGDEERWNPSLLAKSEAGLLRLG
jgi:hypothetical protein